MKTLKFIFSTLLMLVLTVGGACAAVAAGPALITTAAVSPVLTALSDYSGEYKDQLFSTLINGMKIAGDVTVEYDVKTKLTFTKLKVSDGARPFSNTEEIEGDELNYSGIELEVLPGKRELSIDVKRYLNSWLQTKKNITGASQTEGDIPFAEYTWTEVIKSLATEINDQTAYFGFDKTTVSAWANGVYDPGDLVTHPVNGITNYYECVTTTLAAESPSTTAAKWKKVNARAIAPGLGFHLAELITDGDVVPTTTGAITNANAYEKLWLIWNDVAEPFKEAGVKCYLSRNTYENFVKNYESEVGKYTLADGSTRQFLPGTSGKCEFVIASWMAGSNRVIMTPMDNIYMGTNEESDFNDIEIVKSTLWILKAGISFVVGFKFRDAEAIWCNDQV